MARYDFAVFGYLITEISTNFFPPGQGARLRLIEAFGVFGGAFLMRPLGGVLFGRAGDQAAAAAGSSGGGGDRKAARGHALEGAR